MYNKGYPNIHSLIRAVLYWAMFILLLFLLSSFIGSFFPSKWERYVYGTLGTISAILTTWTFLKIEKRSFKDTGLVWERGTLIRFFKGILIGTIIFSMLIVLLLAFAPLQLEKNKEAIDPWSGFWYLAVIPLALMEEIAFRSYPFLKLNKAFGLRLTQVIVALAFALYHLISGWSLYSSFLGPGIWAIVFGLSAVWSGGIAMPTGIHLALNILQPLLGMTGGYGSIWILKHKEGISEDAIARTENIGLAVQLAVLVSAVILTEFYIRRQRITRKKYENEI